MTVAKQLTEQLSLRKLLLHTGISHNKWYYLKTPRKMPVDKTVSDVIQRIGTKRPTYGTSRMTAAISRELHIPVNRKKIQRIYQNWE